MFSITNKTAPRANPGHSTDSKGGPKSNGRNTTFTESLADPVVPGSGTKRQQTKSRLAKSVSDDQSRGHTRGSVDDALLQMNGVSGSTSLNDERKRNNKSAAGRKYQKKTSQLRNDSDDDAEKPAGKPRRPKFTNKSAYNDDPQNRYSQLAYCEDDCEVVAADPLPHNIGPVREFDPLPFTVGFIGPLLTPDLQFDHDLHMAAVHIRDVEEAEEATRVQAASYKAADDLFDGRLFMTANENMLQRDTWGFYAVPTLRRAAAAAALEFTTGVVSGVHNTVSNNPFFGLLVGASIAGALLLSKYNSVSLTEWKDAESTRIYAIKGLVNPHEVCLNQVNAMAHSGFNAYRIASISREVLLHFRATKFNRPTQWLQQQLVQVAKLEFSSRIDSAIIINTASYYYQELLAHYHMLDMQTGNIKKTIEQC